MPDRTPIIYTTDDGVFASDTLGRYIGASADNQPAVFEMQAKRARHVIIVGRDTTAAGKKVIVSRFRINILTQTAYDGVPSKGALPGAVNTAILGNPLPVAPPGGYFITGKKQENVKGSTT